MVSQVVCIRQARNKRGGICGLPVADPELLLCQRHARQDRERRRLRELVLHGGHTISRQWRTLSGDLMDDPYFYVSEHMQIPDAERANRFVLERQARAAIDACNVERVPGCNVPVQAARPHAGADPDWERFKLSRD